MIEKHRNPPREHANESDREASGGKVARLLPRREVLARVGIGQSTLYDWMKRGEFPRPVALGSKRVGWRESDIEAWISACAVKVS